MSARWMFVLIAAMVLVVVWGTLAYPQEQCPPPHKTCKVIVVTPEDEQMLVAPNMIFDMAEWSSRPLYQFTTAWREKLRLAPVRNSELPAATVPPIPPRQQ